MTAPMGNGVLYRAVVLTSETIGTTTTATLDFPAIAPGCRYGPIPSAVPGLQPGERVIVAALGTKRDDFVVVQRWSPRWPTIDEVPGLADALGGSATAFDLSQVRERVEDETKRRVALRDDLRSLVKDHGTTRSRVDEIPDVLARFRAESTDARAALRTELLGRDDSDRAESRLSLTGASDRGAVVPQCEIRPTQDITGLAANTDLIISSLWSSVRDTEASAGRTAMVTIGSSAALPTKVRIPADGDYDVIYSARTPSNALLAGKVLYNPDSSATAAAQVANYSLFSDYAQGSGGTEGTLLRLRDTGRFAANDVLVFAIFCSAATWTVSQLYFGQVRTRIRVIRRPS